MLPSITEVIFIDKALVLTKANVSESYLAWMIDKPIAPDFRDAIALVSDTKFVEMRIGPAHGDLKRVMQIRNATVVANQQAAPDHRADFPQPYPQLIDEYRVVWIGHLPKLVGTW